MISGLFGGYETTSVTLARVLQLLGSANSDELIQRLVQELDADARTDGTTPNSGATISKNKAVQGIFSGFPLLDAVVLESFRLAPIDVVAPQKTSPLFNNIRCPALPPQTGKQITLEKAKYVSPQATICTRRRQSRENLSKQMITVFYSAACLKTDMANKLWRVFEMSRQTPRAVRYFYKLKVCNRYMEVRPMTRQCRANG